MSDKFKLILSIYNTIYGTNKFSPLYKLGDTVALTVDGRAIAELRGLEKDRAPHALGLTVDEIADLLIEADSDVPRETLAQVDPNFFLSEIHYLYDPLYDAEYMASIFSS